MAEYDAVTLKRLHVWMFKFIIETGIYSSIFC